MKQTDGTGVPLGAEEDGSYVNVSVKPDDQRELAHYGMARKRRMKSKYLFFDLGIMQTMLGIPSADILLASEVDFNCVEVAHARQCSCEHGTTLA